MWTLFAFLSIFLDRRQENGLFGQQRLSVTLEWSGLNYCGKCVNIGWSKTSLEGWEKRGLAQSCTDPTVVM